MATGDPKKAFYHDEDPDELISYLYWGPEDKYGENKYRVRIMWDSVTKQERERVQKLFAAVLSDCTRDRARSKTRTRARARAKLKAKADSMYPLEYVGVTPQGPPQDPGFKGPGRR